MFEAVVSRGLADRGPNGFGARFSTMDPARSLSALIAAAGASGRFFGPMVSGLAGSE